MLKAIIFDLDNTLIDFMKMKRLCSEVAIDGMIDAGLKMPRKKAVKKLFEMYWKHGIEDQNIFSKFLKEVNGEVDDRVLASAIVPYRKLKDGLLTPYPGVRRTLAKLRQKGLKLAIVTDAPRLQAWLRLVAMNLDDYFDFVVAYEDTGKRKPHAMPFNAALKKLNLKAEQCMMVGDWPDRDMVGAKKLGMKTCFAKYGWQFKKPLPKIEADYEIKSIEEISDIL